MKPKVLITGASGFVGFHLIEKAIEKDLDVYAAIRKSSNIQHLLHHHIHYTYPDFTSVDSLAKELKEKQYDYIIHAAGVTKAKTLADYNSINVDFTLNLAAAIDKSGIVLKKLVVISSLAALGPLKHQQASITEDTTPTPVTAYGKSKLLAEEELGKFKIPVVILRPTAVYGPRDKDIFIILKTIANGFEPYIGKINQRLSFVYVKDLATVTIDSLFTEATGAFNISDGHCYDRYELANVTKKYLRKKAFKIHLPQLVVKLIATILEKSFGLMNKTPALNIEKLQELTAVNWCCKIEKARTEINFKPAYNLQQGLGETLKWYKENNWL